MADNSRIEDILQRGIEFHRKNQFLEAEACYKEVLGIDPKNADAIHLLGLLADSIGDKELAVDLIGIAISLQSGSAIFHNNLANILKGLDRHEEAIAHYLEALKIDPGYLEASFNLANLYRDLGRPEDAINLYQQATTIAPDFANAWINQAEVQHKLGKFEEAIKCYRECLALKPEDALCRSRLVDAFFSLGRKFEVTGFKYKAIKSFEEALEINPSHAASRRKIDYLLNQKTETEQQPVVHSGELAEIKNKVNAISAGYGSALRGLESAIRRLETRIGWILVDNDNIRNELEQNVKNRLDWIATDNDNMRSRIEFVRKEILFELKKQLGASTPHSALAQTELTTRIINADKVSRAGPKKLNLGCGHIQMADYINIDSRELPGVDVISDIAALPFETHSIDTIYAAHLIEHFPERTLRDVILPHWLDLLKRDGTLILIAPNAQAMLDAYSKGDVNFEQLREVTFGGQEYDGDYHYTMVSPQSLINILTECGFKEFTIIASDRRNGECLEFEVHARPGHDDHRPSQQA